MTDLLALIERIDALHTRFLEWRIDRLKRRLWRKLWRGTSRAERVVVAFTED